jgi:hypothetical protein
MERKAIIQSAHPVFEWDKLDSGGMKLWALKRLPMELNRWDSHGVRDERVFGH